MPLTTWMWMATCHEEESGAMKKKGGNQAWLAAMESGQKWTASGNLERAEKKFRLATRIDSHRREP